MTTSDDAALREAIKPLIRRWGWLDDEESESALSDVMQLITQHTEAAVQAAENALLAEMLTLIDNNMAYPELKGMVDVDALKSAVTARFGKGAA